MDFTTYGKLSSGDRDEILAGKGFWYSTAASGSTALKVKG
jgi:hypothetical protein